MADAVQEPEGGIDNTLASAFAAIREQVAAAEPGEDVPTDAAADADVAAADGAEAASAEAVVDAEPETATEVEPEAAAEVKVEAEPEPEAAPSPSRGGCRARSRAVPSPSPRRLQSPSPRRLQSPSPSRSPSPKPRRLQSPSPRRLQSPSPMPNRSRHPLKWRRPTRIRSSRRRPPLPRRRGRPGCLRGAEGLTRRTRDPASRAPHPMEQFDGLPSRGGPSRFQDPARSRCGGIRPRDSGESGSRASSPCSCDRYHRLLVQIRTQGCGAGWSC